MTTLTPKSSIDSITATEVKFENQWLNITLNTGQVIDLAFQDIPWLKWLAQATLEQQSNGIEVCHLMTDRYSVDYANP